ncbi:MAG: hypothetical protein KDA91_03390 [Planctomycetaceae bacterium]|nr:hypothetical protein [Planctomycetaceae bacterium]
MRGPGSRPGLLFKLIVPATAVFIITILSLIALLFSDQKAPLAQWLDANANRLLAVELIVVIGLALMAMTIDRMQILRAQRQASTETTNEAESPASRSADDSRMSHQISSGQPGSESPDSSTEKSSHA